MRERRLPVWFSGVLVAFVAAMILLAYAVDPPLALLIVALIAVCPLWVRLVAPRLEARERTTLKTAETEAEPGFRRPKGAG